MKMKSKTKKRLLSFLGWLGLFIFMLVALVFIFAAQVFHEANLKAWGNIFSTVGSIMLSTSSYYWGSRVEQQKQRENENSRIRREETSTLREYLKKLDLIIQQFRDYEKLTLENRENQADLVWYQIEDEVEEIKKDTPSAYCVSSEEYRFYIQEKLNKIVEDLNDLISDKNSMNLQRSTNELIKIIIEYEDLSS